MSDTKDILKKKREEEREKLLLLHDKYSENYRELLHEYEALKERKQELGITKGRTRATVARRMPEIPFLKKDHDAAKEYLKRLSLRYLKKLSGEIEYNIELGYEYNTIFNWNIETRSLIRIAEAAIAAKEEMAKHGSRGLLTTMQCVNTKT